MAINVLEPRVYNRISAGEVVERPSSIVKELVENSIDAGSTEITIEIENGGITKIQVSDDGCGIEKDDLVVAFKPHATSKIKDVEDLDNIMSLGFRGEALASISSVCHVYLSSKTAGNEVGYSISVDGGYFSEVEEVVRQKGTTLIARDLFYNTPVRAKFLRKPKSEEAEITHLVEKFMLAHPEISFQYYIDGKLLYNTRCGSMQDIIYTIYGRDVYDSLIEVDYKERDYSLQGFITKPKISKSNRTFQTLFVNKRYVENFLISSAVQGVYENFLMKGKFPLYVLNLTVPGDSVDVNVHPSKREVKFDNSSWIFGFVRRAIEKALIPLNQIATVNFEEEDLPEEEDKSEFNLKGFNPFLRFEHEPISETEGSRYIVSVDHTEGLKPLEEVVIDTQPTKYVDKRQPKIPPNLSGLKLEDEKIPLNEIGNGDILFDHSKDNFAAEIMFKNQEHIEKEKFLTSSVADEMKILGSIFNTYILIELGQSVFFIDQHAAHERLLFDKLEKDINSNVIVKQDLLVPYVFTLGALEVLSMERVIEELGKIGFTIKNIEGYSYELSSIPIVLTELDLQSFVNEIVKESISYDKKPSEFIHNKICQSACKHAIKGGDTLSKDQYAYLIEQIRKGVMLCPHGRPVCIEFTKNYIEKLFGRIV